MSMTPLEIALERIEECRRTRSTSLDLSKLGLDAIPEQVFELTWLEKLDVSGKLLMRGNIRELPAAIGQLTALIDLNCSSNPISDLSALAHVPNLQTLYCHFNQISDLSALAHVPNLQTLYCSWGKISDLSALAHVPNLQTLDCHFNQISDLSALAHVPNLQTLGCGSNQISDLSALAHVPNLQTLDCSSNQISDLSALAHVPNLQTLDCSSNQISDLSPLSGLPALQSLSCRENQISHVTLNDLPALQSLDCSSNQISHVTLSGLPALQSLDCSHNQISDLSPIYHFVISGQLKRLYLYGNPACGIPSGILGNHGGDCLENLKNYWLDLDNGKERQQQLKVQFVGNGRVGKTTLAYALQHKRPPSEPFKSTHGIVIKEIQQALDGEEEPVTLQLWDFGGQEIYHATHRLFLSDDCLYLLLWAEETEEHPDEIRHPVSYWLELIHDLGKTSPVILVKSQIDHGHQSLPYPHELAPESKGVDQIWQTIQISATKYWGMSTLVGAIQDILELAKDQIYLNLPSSWLQVQRELKQLNKEKIPFAHFKQLCIKAGVSHAEWFAGYLHKTGALFYREGAFQDQIILDQNWAINAVYRVFDPQACRDEVEERRGRFKGKLTRTLWPEADDTEREIYIDFMRNSGICYEPRLQQNQRDNKPFAEREFIIPALLPTTSKAKTAWGDSRPDEWQLDIEYPFLHRSIIERIILRIGETYEGEPWRTGIFCHTDEGQLLLECEYADKQQSTQGRLHFQLRGSQLDRLVYALRKLVSETSPHRRYQEYLSKGTAERTQLPEFEQNPQITTPLEETKAVSKTVKLFISYSHVDEAHKDELVLCLKNIQRRLPLEYWDDRQMFAGELVDQQILPRLEAADIVVLLISRNFFASNYCFSIEMEKALKRFEQNNNIVIPVIIRPTDDWHDFEIGKITALPTDGKPLSKWDDKDEFWADVQKGIRKQVEKLAQP